MATSRIFRAGREPAIPPLSGARIQNIAIEPRTSVIQMDLDWPGGKSGPKGILFLKCRTISVANAKENSAFLVDRVEILRDSALLREVRRPKDPDLLHVTLHTTASRIEIVCESFTVQ